MTTEITVPEDNEAVPIAIVTAQEPDTSDTPARRPRAPKEPKDPKAAEPKSATEGDGFEETKRAPMSPEIRALRSAEDKNLKDMIESFGDHTAYKIKVSRKEPETYRDRATGKIVNTGGFLRWVEGKPIDEEWVQSQFGGGKYELIFRKKGNRGGWEYGGAVTLQIAGDPDLSSLPSAGGETPATAATPAATGENPGMAKHAMDLMARQLEREQERSDRGGGKSDPMIEMLRDELKESRRQLAEMGAQYREAANRPPPQTTEDKVKDTILTKLMDQDSARVQATRAQYESELRQAKESAIDNEKRLYDRFERDRQDMRNAHERELALLRSSHEANLAAARSSFEMSLQAAKSSFDTQKEIMTADNRRLDRDNSELRVEVKELRAKKEKTVIEQFKEMEIIKDAIGSDADNSDKGMGEKLLEGIGSPEGMAALKSIFGKSGPEVAPPPAPVAEPPRRRVVMHADGQRYMQYPDGTLRGPLKPKAKPGSAPEESAMPQIDPASITLVVGYLERAFTGNQDPEIVAQSLKPQVPDPVMSAIRDVGGVDAFLAKVAKLPGSSPLASTQLGRNWVRKVGKALVGE